MMSRQDVKGIRDRESTRPEERRPSLEAMADTSNGRNKNPDHNRCQVGQMEDHWELKCRLIQGQGLEIRRERNQRRHRHQSIQEHEHEKIDVEEISV